MGFIYHVVLNKFKFGSKVLRAPLWAAIDFNSHTARVRRYRRSEYKHTTLHFIAYNQTLSEIINEKVGTECWEEG